MLQYSLNHSEVVSDHSAGRKWKGGGGGLKHLNASLGYAIDFCFFNGFCFPNKLAKNKEFEFNELESTAFDRFLKLTCRFMNKIFQ